MKVGDLLDKLHRARRHSDASEKSGKPARKSWGTRVRQLSVTSVVVAIVVIAASFYLGTRYEKAHVRNAAFGAFSSQKRNQMFGNPGMNGGFGGRSHFGRHGSFSASQVTSVSSSSITVKDSNGNSKTFAINASTQITDAGKTVSASDIKTGDKVFVLPNRSDLKTARRIIVNPNFGNRPSMQAPNVSPSQPQLN